MANLEDLQKIEDYNNYSYKSHGHESLLEKYRIPIQHFDFEYIKIATNFNELEKIIEVLHSGQEGHYPDLLRTAEERLTILKPNSKLLRQTTKVLHKNELKINESQFISEDIQKFIVNISKNNQELNEKGKFVKSNNNSGIKIRQSFLFEPPQPEPLNLVKKKQDKRISSTDYKAWDKYDADTEILKQDLEEKKIIKAAIKNNAELENSIQNAPSCSSSSNSFTMVTANKESLRKLKKNVSFKEFSTTTETLYISDRELEKGREFFKSGEYELAIKSFTQSIIANPTIVNLNNRALSYLKMKNFTEALNDCDQVLAIQSKNLKALLRKAQALEGLKKYEEALDCVDAFIEKEPNNCYAQELADRVRKYCRNILKNTRMKIIEIK